MSFFLCVSTDDGAEARIFPFFRSIYVFFVQDFLDGAGAGTALSVS